MLKYTHFVQLIPLNPTDQGLGRLGPLMDNICEKMNAEFLSITTFFRSTEDGGKEGLWLLAFRKPKIFLAGDGAAEFDPSTQPPL